ncbi:hypothetical protein KTAU_10140, partial [Thermogemmatispora aurantia]
CQDLAKVYPYQRSGRYRCHAGSSQLLPIFSYR